MWRYSTACGGGCNPISRISIRELILPTCVKKRFSSIDPYDPGMKLHLVGIFDRTEWCLDAELRICMCSYIIFKRDRRVTASLPLTDVPKSIHVRHDILSLLHSFYPWYMFQEVFRPYVLPCNIRPQKAVPRTSQARYNIGRIPGYLQAEKITGDFTGNMRTSMIINLRTLPRSIYLIYSIGFSGDCAVVNSTIIRVFGSSRIVRFAVIFVFFFSWSLK